MEIKRILTSYERKRDTLIPILQKVQEKFGYLSEEVVFQIAEYLGISANEIFGVATFYTQFRFTRPGEHNIKVCLGTACYVRGGNRIMETAEKELGIKPGETTFDYKFDLERVACFGCCALAPVVVADKKVYAKMTQAKVKNLIETYRKL